MKAATASPTVEVATTGCAVIPMRGTVVGMGRTVVVRMRCSVVGVGCAVVGTVRVGVSARDAVVALPSVVAVRIVRVSEVRSLGRVSVAVDG